MAHNMPLMCFFFLKSQNQKAAKGPATTFARRSISSNKTAPYVGDSTGTAHSLSYCTAHSLHYFVLKSRLKVTYQSLHPPLSPLRLHEVIFATESTKQQSLRRLTQMDLSIFLRTAWATEKNYVGLGRCRTHTP